MWYLLRWCWLRIPEGVTLGSRERTWGSQNRSCGAFRKSGVVMYASGAGDKYETARQWWGVLQEWLLGSRLGSDCIRDQLWASRCLQWQIGFSIDCLHTALRSARPSDPGEVEICTEGKRNESRYKKNRYELSVFVFDSKTHTFKTWGLWVFFRSHNDSLNTLKMWNYWC